MRRGRYRRRDMLTKSAPRIIRRTHKVNLIRLPNRPGKRIP